MHRFGSVADSSSTKCQVFNQTKDAQTVFCGNLVNTGAYESEQASVVLEVGNDIVSVADSRYFNLVRSAGGSEERASYATFKNSVVIFRT